MRYTVVRKIDIAKRDCKRQVAHIGDAVVRRSVHIWVSQLLLTREHIHRLLNNLHPHSTVSTAQHTAQLAQHRLARHGSALITTPVSTGSHSTGQHNTADCSSEHSEQV